jgi:hypothetical protein
LEKTKNSKNEKEKRKKSGEGNSQITRMRGEAFLLPPLVVEILQNTFCTLDVFLMVGEVEGNFSWDLQ